jgi:uncharacterized protein (UPF0333 family)
MQLRSAPPSLRTLKSKNMFNLLPLIEKKFISAEYTRRKMTVVLAFLLFLIVIAAVFLVPSFIISQFRLSEVSQTVSALQANNSIQNQAALKDKIHMANKKVATLSMGTSSAPVTSVLEGIASEKTADIKITSFSLTREGAASLTLKGTAATRESLLSFANKLKADTAYKKVDLPISNFAKDENIGFTVTLTLK